MTMITTNVTMVNDDRYDSGDGSAASQIRRRDQITAIRDNQRPCLGNNASYKTHSKSIKTKYNQTKMIRYRSNVTD